MKVNVSGVNEEYMTVSIETHRMGRTELSYVLSARRIHKSWQNKRIKDMSYSTLTQSHRSSR